MSEVATRAYTHLNNPLIEAAWENLRHEAEEYASGFYIPDGLQDPLPELEEFCRDDKTRSDVVNFLAQNPEYIGGDTEFVKWNIAARACWAGISGNVNVGEQPPAVENGLIVNNLENYSGPQPTKKLPSQAYFISIFSPAELTKYVSYWYRIGAEDRLDGTVHRGQQDNLKDLLDDEWPLLSDSLETYAVGPNMDQDALPGVHDEEKEQVRKRNSATRWREALYEAKDNGALNHIPYGETFHQEDVDMLIQQAAGLLGEELPAKDSEEYAELCAIVRDISADEQRDNEYPYDDWYDEYDVAEDGGVEAMK
jgi:hypothetical protein